MNETEIRKLINKEIDERLSQLTEAEEGIVMVKSPLELEIEKKQKEKEWIQSQM